jgi:hypothetical protein
LPRLGDQCEPHRQPETTAHTASARPRSYAAARWYRKRAANSRVNR